jgi:hypothetical protein
MTQNAARATPGLIRCLMLCAPLFVPGLAAAGDPAAFDGEWDTIVSCPNSNGALGYSFEFPSHVKDGVLHGDKGVKGEAGWLQFDGTIAADGTASLYASGLVGASEMAVGHRPVGTSYGYHVDVRFSGASGTGHRVEGRPCTVTFTKKP